jgi:hypothetical protein
MTERIYVSRNAFLVAGIAAVLTFLGGSTCKNATVDDTIHSGVAPSCRLLDTRTDRVRKTYSRRLPT